MGRRLQNKKEEKMNNTVGRCALCGGELMPGKTTLELWRGDELIVIRDVLADVCQQCREAYLSADVSEQLDHFLDEYHHHQPERCLVVPQYSATQAMGR